MTLILYLKTIAEGNDIYSFPKNVLSIIRFKSYKYVQLAFGSEMHGRGLHILSKEPVAGFVRLIA